MPKLPNTARKSLFYAYLAWALISFFYLYQYILRASLGSMIDDLRIDLHLNAQNFSTLSSYYLLAYSLLQIPLGIIVDRFGLKSTVFTSVLLCGIGSLLFAQADVLWMAQLGRFIIGAGSACAFMCALKVVSDNFPPGQRGLLMGITLTLGSLGALANGRYTHALVAEHGWRSVYIWLAYFGGGIFLFMLLMLRHFHEPAHKQMKLTMRNVFRNVKSAISKKDVVIYAILALGLYTPFSVLADLWGPAFLQQKFGLAHNAAPISSTMFLGLAVGSLLLPWLCEKYNILNKAIRICSLSILAIFCLILYAPHLSTNGLLCLLFMLGFFCGAEMMCFTGALRSASVDNSGEIIGFVNTLNMLGGACLQYIIGYLLDHLWRGTNTANGIRFYSAAEYTYALSLLTIIVAVCCALSFLLEKDK